MALYSVRVGASVLLALCMVAKIIISDWHGAFFGEQAALGNVLAQIDGLKKTLRSSSQHLEERIGNPSRDEKFTAHINLLTDVEQSLRRPLSLGTGCIQSQRD